MSAHLKAMLQDVEHELAVRKINERLKNELLKPLSELTDDETFITGSQFGRLIFRSVDRLEQFDLPAPIQPLFSIGSYFNIRPVLGSLNLPPEMYLLKLSGKQVELLRCADLRAERVALPKGVPQTLAEALEFKQPDHDLENRSFIHGSTGNMRGVRFGTGSGRETQRTYLADFYKLIDRGIIELLHTGEAPLVLAGVEEDTAAYLAIHSYPGVLSRSIHGSPNAPVTDQELVDQVYAIVRAEQIEHAVRAMRDWRERMAPPRFTTHLKTILRAAAQGRIDKLYIDESARETGNLAKPAHNGWWNREPEDLLNVAAVETILHGGSAFGLPASKMPDGAAAAAVLRY
jgi:hypothetical protein